MPRVIIWLAITLVADAVMKNVDMQSNVVVDGLDTAPLRNSSSRHQTFKKSVSRPHPNIVQLLHGTTACSAKFISLSARPLDMYW